MTKPNEVNQELIIFEDGSVCLFLNEAEIDAKWSIYKKIIDLFVELTFVPEDSSEKGEGKT